jgi:hypothetical protein
MNELKQLQILNDLIAQTIEVINQRAAIGSGLSHTPWGATALGASLVNPYTPSVLSHTPFVPTYGSAFSPLAPYVPHMASQWPVGLSHTAIDPRLAYGASVPFSQFPVSMQSQPFGLSHTGVDPRYYATPMLVLDSRFVPPHVAPVYPR